MRSGKAVLLVAFLVVAGAHEARPDDIIRIGIISTTFGYAPVFVAKEKGFFKREGLVPEIVVISRNEQIVQALISDSLQFGNVPPNLLLTLRQQGMSEIKLIAGSFNGTTYSMITLAEVQKNGGAERQWSAVGDVRYYLGCGNDDERGSQTKRRSLSPGL